MQPALDGVARPLFESVAIAAKLTEIDSLADGISFATVLLCKFDAVACYPRDDAHMTVFTVSGTKRIETDDVARHRHILASIGIRIKMLPYTGFIKPSMGIAPQSFLLPV